MEEVFLKLSSASHLEKEEDVRLANKGGTDENRGGLDSIPEDTQVKLAEYYSIPIKVISLNEIINLLLLF